MIFRGEKKKNDLQVSLFPFLSILACVLGILTLMIMGVVVSQVSDDAVNQKIEEAFETDDGFKEKMEEENQFDLLHKKEALRLRREIEKLNKFFRGIKNMKDLPDALFIVDTRKEKIAQAEGKKLGIKIIAMIDTNSDPDGVDFPIPANDDAMRSIKLFTHRIADVCLEGQEMRKASQDKEEKKSPTPSDSQEPVAVANDKGSNETSVPA